MRRVHREATKRVVANLLGRNGMRGRVHREGLDGTADGNEEWRTAERRKRPCVRPATFETGSCSSGGVWRTAKRDSTGYCSSPPSTPSSIHELLFIHHRPPPASTCDCSSTGSCSSSLHRALLHRLLFNHPSTGTPPPSTVHPALHTTGSCSTTPPRAPLHRLLFIQPSTGSSCSSSHPHHGVLFIQRQRHRSLFIQTPRNTHYSSQRQHRSASVSSSSEGIARSGSVNSHRSIARVQ